MSRKAKKTLYLSDEQYLAALCRIRSQISLGLKLVFWDDETPGCKETHCSWGLCSKNKQQWPDAEDHIWPDQFRSQGRVAPLYTRNDQTCPFDMRTRPNKSGDGCFWHCRIFQQKQEPTREEALALYDAEIARVDGQEKSDG